MTREEAIENLKILKEDYWDDNGYGHETKQYDGTMLALDMAIKALEQEPCDDCVRRQEVLDEMYKRRADGDAITAGFIKNLPPVTPQPKTGQWINIEDRTDWYDTSYKCSCCGREIITPYDFKNNLYSDYPYCHCGARMVEPQESEE